jgi:hypothetical protein
VTYEAAVVGQPIEVWITGLTPPKAVCGNATTGQVLTLSDPTIPWNCGELSLVVSSGDDVALHVGGPVKKSGMDVGGAVTGMVPHGGGRTNRTTGQQVQLEALSTRWLGACVRMMRRSSPR